MSAQQRGLPAKCVEGGVPQSRLRGAECRNLLPICLARLLIEAKSLWPASRRETAAMACVLAGRSELSRAPCCLQRARMQTII